MLPINPYAMLPFNNLPGKDATQKTLTSIFDLTPGMLAVGLRKEGIAHSEEKLLAGHSNVLILYSNEIKIGPDQFFVECLERYKHYLIDGELYAPCFEECHRESSRPNDLIFY